MVDEKQELISVRNLVEGEARTPLRKFYGVLDSYAPEEWFGTTRVNLNFKDLEVLASVEPYQFPIATIPIKLSNRKSSGWGIFGESLAQCIPEDEDLKDCIGKRLGMEMEEGHEFGVDRATQEKMLGNVWRVFEVEGVVAGASTTTANDQAQNLLDGRSLSEFNKLAFADPIVRKDSGLVKSITNKSFVKGLVDNGLFAKDENDVYHKV